MLLFCESINNCSHRIGGFLCDVGNKFFCLWADCCVLYVNTHIV